MREWIAVTDADLATAGVIIGIVVLAIIIILLANRNAKGGVIVQDAEQAPPRRDKQDVFPRENNRPIGESMRPASLSFCPSCGRRLHGTAFVCPYCKKRL
jgi:hypothetical protein